ncbi:hypothetical protein DL89DRAFT_206279, partial [Linderina pennispora]
LVNGVMNQWDLFLPFAQYCINCNIVRRHQSAPFAVMFGRAPNSWEDHSEAVAAPASARRQQQRADFMKNVLFPAIENATKKVAEAYVQQHAKTHKIMYIPVGTYVMTIQHNRASKLDPANEGPYLVTAITRGGSYVLKDMEGQQLARNYTVSELHPISDEPLFEEASLEVDKILGHRVNKTGDHEYRVRWKSSSEADSWEPFENFDSPRLIREYWQKLDERQQAKSAPKR